MNSICVYMMGMDKHKLKKIRKILLNTPCKRYTYVNFYLELSFFKDSVIVIVCEIPKNVQKTAC